MAAIRPIEDFFCNPTFKFTMEGEPRTSMASDMSFEEYRRSIIMPTQEMFSFKPGKKTPEPTATIKSFAEDPMFWRGYTSDEEVASPVASDDMSFHSASSDSEQSSEPIQTASPKHIGQSGEPVEQQCSKAQAVTLVSAGKAKVVSMPKLVDVSTAPRMRRPATVAIRPPVSRLNRLDIKSQTSVSNNHGAHTSSEKRSAAATEYAQRTRTVVHRQSIDERPTNVRQRLAVGTDERRKRTRNIQQRPSLPNLQATARSESGTPDSLPARLTRLPKAADFLEYDPHPSQLIGEPTTPTTPTMPISPSRRRLHKISSSIGLSVFGGKVTKRNNSLDGMPCEDLETVKEPEPVMISPRPAEKQAPTRVPSARPKMIARGASERAPPLVLPPCPESYEDEADVTSWPQRSGSVLAVQRPMNMTKLHKRQRSMSAALVSAQA